MKKNVYFISLVSLLIFCISACSEPSTEEYLAEAEKWLSKSNKQSAIVNLKNAAKNEPLNPLIRFKLGKTYLELGSPAASEKELKLALDRGYDANTTLPLLAKSLILQFKNKEVVELVSNSKNLSLEASTTLYTLQALAYFQLGNSVDANKAIFNANEISAESPYAHLGQAYAAFNKDEIDIALKTVDMLLSEQPEFTEALLLKGQLENAKGNFKEAINSFEKYHKLLPELIQGKIYLVDSYIKNGQLEKAETYTNQMLALNSNSSFINQLKSKIRFELKDFEAAKTFSEKAIDYGGQNQVTSTIAAVSSFQLGLNEQAYRHFSAIIDALPSNSPLRGVYEVLELTLGYKIDGLSSSEAIKGLSEQNSSLLIHSSLKLIQDGKLSQAKDFIDVIDSKNITDPIELTRLSMAKLSLNDKSAIQDLERVLSTSSKNVEAQNILARAYTAEEDFDNALKVAKLMISESPNKVDGYNLAGFIFASSGEIEEAQKQHLKALEISANDVTSTVFFGKLALSQKDYKVALNTYRRLMTFKPLYLPALITYYELEKKFGVSEEAIYPIKKAYENEPNNIQYTLFYAKLLETEKNYTKALQVLEKIPVSQKRPERYWELLISLQSKLNRTENLETTLIGWTSNNPTSGLGWRTLANFYESKGDIKKALVTVTSGQKFANTDKNNLKVLESQHYIYLNRVTEAQKTIDELTKIYSINNPVIELLNAQILILKHKFEDALPKLVANYQFKPSEKVLKLILNCFIKLDQKDEAIQFAKSHIEKYPEGNTAKLYLANLVMDKDKDYSEQLYREVLESEKLHSIALNNLAAVLQQKGKHKEAVEVTLRALNLAPNEPYLLEIYASALLKNKNESEALSAYAKAYDKSGKSVQYAKFYIDALRATGNETMAQKISHDADIN
jgi:putative PEP-CTERM system TPR-repeat lipoprotein